METQVDCVVGIDLASLRREMKGVISANMGAVGVMKRDRTLIGLCSWSLWSVPPPLLPPLRHVWFVADLLH